MISLLNRLLGRLPIGYLQLTHNKSRMMAAIAGVAFANILVFIQLGMLGALNSTIRLAYSPLEADLVISSIDANTLSDGSNITRRYLYKALGTEDVRDGTPLYIGTQQWKLPSGDFASILVYGISPSARLFIDSTLYRDVERLKHQDTALVDTKTRGLKQNELSEFSFANPYSFEIKGITLYAIGEFSLGGSFNFDGGIIVSDQTFFRMFPNRKSGTPSHILLKLKNESNPFDVTKELEVLLENESVKVRTFRDMIENDLEYQTTQKPVGIIFGFGVFIGLLVGLVIVYQILSTDVADHLSEYATFKAIGYDDKFFLGIVLEEAVVLAVLAFVPAVIISYVVYILMSNVTGLPIDMTATRMAGILFGTMVASIISGYIATRRLVAADPANLF